MQRQAPAKAQSLVCEAIQRATQAEQHVHAWVQIDADKALDAASAADRALARGPLFGLPSGVKDVISVAGMPTGCGSRAFSGQPATEDADAVAAIKRAGAIVLGKQVTHELTIGLDEPATRNPW